MFTFCYRSLKEACPLCSWKTLSHSSGLLATWEMASVINKTLYCVISGKICRSEKTHRRIFLPSFYYSVASKDVHVYCKISNFPKNVGIIFSIRKFYMFFAWSFKIFPLPADTLKSNNWFLIILWRNYRIICKKRKR